MNAIKFLKKFRFTIPFLYLILLLTAMAFQTKGCYLFCRTFFNDMGWILITPEIFASVFIRDHIYAFDLRYSLAIFLILIAIFLILLFFVGYLFEKLIEKK